MGVVVSYLNGNIGSNEPDPVTGLTPKEKLLVGQTWNVVKKDLTGYGVQLFLEFFKSFPHYQKLFPFRDVPYDELANDSRVKGHATSVMYSLSSLVDNLNKNEVLVDLLQKNGLSHAKRYIPEQAYWDLKSSALEFFQNQLGPKLTKEGKEAWDKTLTVAFNVITKTLKDNEPNDRPC